MVARFCSRPVNSPFPLLLLAATAALPSAGTKLVTLAAVAPKIDPDNLPGEIQVLKWGDNQTTKGIVRVGKKTLACLSANQVATGFDEVCLDFNHNTVEGSPAYKGEPAPVAATHCKPEVREGQGLFLMSVNWTDDGKKFASSYPDVSGAVGLDESGEVIFIHSAGVCRQGCAQDIKLFSASMTGLKGLQKVGRSTPPLVTTLAATDIDLDALRSLLRLSAEATPADINAAVSAALDDIEDDETPGSTVVKKTVKTLSATVDRLTLLVEGSQRQTILDEARAAGKEVPAEWLPGTDGKGGLPVGQLRTLCATLPEVVPLAARTPSGVQGAKATRTLSAEERSICSGLGISEADYLKVP